MTQKIWLIQENKNVLYVTVAEWYILEEMIVLIFINFIYSCSITPTNVASSNPGQARCTRYTNKTDHDANTGSNLRERRCHMYMLFAQDTPNMGFQHVPCFHD